MFLLFNDTDNSTIVANIDENNDDKIPIVNVSCDVNFLLNDNKSMPNDKDNNKSMTDIKNMILRVVFISFDLINI